jgi:hypothetical protein
MGIILEGHEVKLFLLVHVLKLREVYCLAVLSVTIKGPKQQHVLGIKRGTV